MGRLKLIVLAIIGLTVFLQWAWYMHCGFLFHRYVESVPMCARDAVRSNLKSRGGDNDRRVYEV